MSKSTIAELSVYFRRGEEKLPTLEVQLREMFVFQQFMKDYSPLMHEWLLTGDTKQDAFRHLAFDDHGPTTEALAVLGTENKGIDDFRMISLWNGAEKRSQMASMKSLCATIGRPDNFSFGPPFDPKITDWHLPAAWLQHAISIWPTASFAGFEPFHYHQHKVFEDRPGVGWLCYLPQKLTTREIPEAVQLIPVSRDGQQAGTIIVSCADGPFSLENPEHIKAANAIETRLVDQDLLPRFADL